MYKKRWVNIQLFLLGLYPYKLGRQHGNLSPMMPTGLRQRISSLSNQLLYYTQTPQTLVVHIFIVHFFPFMKKRIFLLSG